MKVLVTGADGLLGSNLVRLLISKGYITSVLLYPHTVSTTLHGLDVIRYFGDITRPDTLNDAFKDQDAVVHAAASTAIWPARSAMVRQINVDGTRNVIESVFTHGIKKLIFIGSASSVNAGNTKTGTYAGARFGLDYIDSKFQALQLVMDAVKLKGLPAVAVLPTFMIGPHDSKPGSGKMILAFARGKLKFYTSGGRNFIHVADVASITEQMLQHSEAGSVVIAGSENLTYRQFFKKVAKITGRPEPLLKIPCVAVKVAGLLGTIFGSLFHFEPVISYPMSRISCEKQFLGNIEVQTEPKLSVDKAIEDCYLWFRENGYL